MTAVMIPSFSSTDPQKLELAAAQVAQAIRFARSEALRSGLHHGVTISQVTQTISVIKWNLATNPVSIETIPYHPINKQSFEFNLDSLSLAHGIRISNSLDIFEYQTIGRRRSLIFNPQGAPEWIMGVDGSRYRLLDANVELGLGQSRININVAPLTGRVTVL